jgi:hypothetical protein
MKKSMRREKESRFNILFDIRKEKQWEIKEKEVCSFSLPLFFFVQEQKGKNRLSREPSPTSIG